MKTNYKQMKTSNIALLSLLCLFLAGMIFTNFILKEEYQNLDLNDPLRNYMSVGADNYSVLKISGSNGYRIEIEGGPGNDVKVLRRRISFFKKELRGDTLVINFSGSNIPMEQAINSSAPTGIIIQGTSFSKIIIEDAYTRIKDISNDKLQLSLSGHSLTEIMNCNIENMYIDAQHRSIFKFEHKNRIDTIDFKLANISSAYIKNVDFSVLKPIVGDSAAVILSNNALNEIIKD